MILFSQDFFHFVAMQIFSNLFKTTLLVNVTRTTYFGIKMVFLSCCVRKISLKFRKSSSWKTPYCRFNLNLFTDLARGCILWKERWSFLLLLINNNFKFFMPLTFHSSIFTFTQCVLILHNKLLLDIPIEIPDLWENSFWWKVKFEMVSLRSFIYLTYIDIKVWLMQILEGCDKSLISFYYGLRQIECLT